MNTLLEAAMRALSEEKIRRAEETTALHVVAATREANADDLLVCKAKVETLDNRRAAAVLSCKPNEVVRIEGALVPARIAVEIAQAKATASDDAYSKAVADLGAIEDAVAAAAHDVQNAELTELSAKVIAARATWLALGAQLQANSSRNFLTTPLNVSIPALPVEVTRALEELPPPDPLNTPLNVLRGARENGDGWQRRFAELIADDEPKSIDAAA
jgi:hypothetical protein